MTQQPKNTNRLPLALGGLVVIAIVVVVLWNTGGKSASPKPKPTPTLAYKLATIQEGSAAGKHDPLVGQFQAALDGIAFKCKQGLTKISDDTVESHKLLAQHAIRESYLSILRHVSRSIPAQAGEMDCDQMFAAYVILRIGG